MITTDLKLAGMVITWCALHSGMISTTVTRYLKHNLGAGFRYYRLYFNFVSTVTLIPIYHYGFVVHDSVLFNWRGPTMVIQVPLAAAGVLLLLAGARHYDMMQFIGFRQISSTTSPGALTQSGWLETSGILSKIRHPWYLAAILLVWARGFNGPMFLINAILTLYVIVGTFLEERKLVEEYGQAYRDYQKDVPMLIPTRWFTDVNKRP
jgi:protein-S-isoprenylcysteine O-methyltransferase Ste14